MEEKVSNHRSKGRDARLVGPQRYEIAKILGKGSFGVVCSAKCRLSGEIVAIKKVLQDPKYKNRELAMMKELSHRNIVTLLDAYHTEEKPEGSHEVALYLNVVMNYVPDTVQRVMQSCTRKNQQMPMILVKLYIYQVCRAVAYMHSVGICHRDIKPQNVLIDAKTHVVKLCDLGSAKRLVKGEASVAYICSRFYRAPELMLGSVEYTTAIDTWSIGCVLGELIKGAPLFAGETSVDQLVKIIQVLGTPTREEMLTMNPEYVDFEFPHVAKKKWHEHFSLTAPQQCYELLSEFLDYDPSARLRPIDALAHPFFDELRDPLTVLPGGGKLPELQMFTRLELDQMSPSTRAVLAPSL